MSLWQTPLNNKIETAYPDLQREKNPTQNKKTHHNQTQKKEPNQTKPKKPGEKSSLA